MISCNQAIQNAVIDQLVKIYGAEARHPKQFMMKDWSQEHWSKGCYVGLYFFWRIDFCLLLIHQTTGVMPAGVLLHFGKGI